MNRRACSLIFIGLVSAASFRLAGLDQSIAQPRAYHYRHDANGERVPKVLQLSGSAYERGLQHGKELRQEIARIVGLWKKDLQMQTKTDPDALLQKFLAETNFVPAIKKWTPELLDEIRGIAEGSGQPYPTILAHQLADEIWVYIDKG
jgi:isopenicillin-N N-acyltransferase-like protein